MERKNQSLIGSKISYELKNLENEYNLSFNVYSNIAQKVENQKIEVKKNTPIFTTIKQIYIPLKRTIQIDFY